MATTGTVKTGLTYAETRFGSLSILGIVVLFSLFQLVEIGSAIIAHGEVVVRGKPRPVQSLESGQVREVFVAEGDSVSAGQVVLELDPALTLINRDILRSRMAELVARQARLEAEREGASQIAPVRVPEGLDADTVQLQVAGQADVFQSRQAVLQSEKAQLAERKQQHQAQVQGLEAQIDTVESQLAFVDQEVENLSSLLTQGLIPESRVLDLQGRQAGLLGQVAVHRTDIARMRNAIRDTDLEITQTDRKFQERAISELREVVATSEEVRLELARSGQLLQQLQVRAPVSGVVHEMQVRASGGVVPRLETLMTIVPVSEGLEFEVQVQPEAIDTVFLGQETRVRFPAFDQRTTPELAGRIAAIAPDSVTDPASGRSFYRVDVSLSDEEMRRLGDLELIPGMPVEAFVQTGDRSILNFLIKPIMDQFVYAFRES